MIFKAF